MGEGGIRVQGKPPQNMPYLYLDNFELKLLKIWPMQEEHSDPLVCLTEKRKSVSHVEGAL